MKQLTILALIPFLSGCMIASRAHVRSDTWTTNKTGEVVHEMRHTETPFVIAWGDAKAFIEKLRLSNGKTHSIGITGFDVETSATNVAAIMKAGGGLIGDAVSAYQEAQGIPKLGTIIPK